MAQGISLLLIKNGQATEIGSLVNNIKWKGRRGAASRTLSVTLLDDDGYKHSRSEIDVMEGHQCLFSYNGTELFRGIIMQQKQSHQKRLSFTAYDNGIYLANNKDTFCYENKTATYIFKDVCNRFGIPYTDVAACGYTIPNLTKRSTTAFDVVCDALSLDYDNTGIRHYIASEKGKLRLYERRENILQWVIETGANLYSYSYTKSIEDIKTRIKLLSDEGTVLAEKIDSGLEKKIGTFQDIDKPDETLTSAQLTALVASMLEEKSLPERTLDISALGVPEVISGVGVFIVIKHLGLSRTFYVDEDTHEFSDKMHTMSLKLNYVSDIGKTTPATTTVSDASSDIKEGDLVEFNDGATVYYPSVKIPCWVKSDYYHVVTQVDYPKGSGKTVTKGGVRCVLLGKKKKKSGGSVIAGINTWTDVSIIHKV